MESEIIVAALGLVGTLTGSMLAGKLTQFRLKAREDKVDKHNRFGERIPVLEEKLKVVNHRLDDLEEVRRL